MGYEIKLTKLTEKKLREIAHFIIGQYALPETALRVVEELEGKINILTENLTRGFKFGDRYRALHHYL
ncbi:type II toxin-antitoxin system RelE/ParE family toxin [Shouchella sp. JSM 1781072]|uniref:type II toxin-antitoxin system RelE/ParE family toxin n=1 Tax=Shouchella sp. JSM 1781072 TaxID=3344581 RepID=UPI0035C0F50D